MLLSEHIHYLKLDPISNSYFFSSTGEKIRNGIVKRKNRTRNGVLAKFKRVQKYYLPCLPTAELTKSEAQKRRKYVRNFMKN